MQTHTVVPGFQKPKLNITNFLGKWLNKNAQALSVT